MTHSQYRCNLQQRSHINTEQYFLFVHQTLCFRPVPFKFITKSWQCFQMLHSISLLLTCFIHSSLYLLIPYPVLSPLSFPLSSGIQKFVLYICESVSVLFFRFHLKDSRQLSLPSQPLALRQVVSRDLGP